MKDDFKKILEATKSGQCADLTIDIEGTSYRRIFRPAERLIILGAGHISKALSVLGAMTNFSVVVVDDRPEYANESRFPEAETVICDDFINAIKSLKICRGDYIAIVTRAHKYDAECLREIVSGPKPYYLGLLGSKRRTKVLIDNLISEGCSKEILESVNTPIGIAIGAVSVEEIAVSIIAEMIAARRSNILNKGKSNVFAEESFNTSSLKSLLLTKDARSLLW